MTAREFCVSRQLDLTGDDLDSELTDEEVEMLEELLTAADFARQFAPETEPAEKRA